MIIEYFFMLSESGCVAGQCDREAEDGEYEDPTTAEGNAAEGHQRQGNTGETPGNHRVRHDGT